MMDRNALKRNLPIKVLLVALILAALQGCSMHTQPRNVILFIGDGMDDHQITIARNYLKGAKGQLAIDRLPVRGAVQVLTVDENNPQQPVYVADSANSATAIATGVVTSRGRIATTANTDRDLRTIIELAEAEKLHTGIVTTAAITDATPASFVAHVSNRGCQGPSTMVAASRFGSSFKGCENDLIGNGGAGSIAEQIAASSVEIYLGGGSKFFASSVEEGKSVMEQAKNNGYQIIERAEELNKSFTQDKVLGLFAEKEMPVRLMGENDRAAEFLEIVDNKAVEPQAFACVQNPQAVKVPSLKAMTETAIKHLNSKNDRGFFLMVESASIDKQSHMRRPCGSIGELEQLDEAVQAALSFAASNPNTLILVTADHGQAAQLVPYPSLFQGRPKAHSIGHLAVIKTPEGSLMGINYATNDTILEEHTGAQIPLLMNHKTSTQLNGVIRQPQLFTLMRDFLKL